MSGPYDLVEVKVMGPTKVEVCHARPIEWNKEPYTQDGRDRSGKFLIPTLYMMTCPKCAGRLDFIPDDIAEDGTVVCNLCDPHAAQMQRKRNIKAREVVEEKAEKTEVADSPEVAGEMEKLKEAMSCKCGKSCQRSKENGKESCQHTTEEKMKEAGITQQDLEKYGVSLVPTEITETASNVKSDNPDVVVDFADKKLRDPLSGDYDKTNLE